MFGKLLPAMLIPLAACSMTGARTVGGSDDDGRPGIPAQGAGGTRTYAVADFTAVDLRGSDDVDIRVGPGFSVRADGDAAVLDHLKIEKVGDGLRIGRIAGAGWSWGGKGARIAVTLPRLTSATIAGSGNVTIDRVQGARFDATGAGSGTMSVGQLAVDEAKVSIAGSGNVKLAGTARTLTIAVAGSGDVAAADLKAQTADISIAGSGSVRTEVGGTAKVSIMGSGDVDVGSTAKCQISKMGSGSVRCGG